MAEVDAKAQALVGTWEAIVGPAVFAASTLTEAQGIYDRGAQ